MPMFLILSSGVVLAINGLNPSPFLLPPVMRESLVGFGHAVDVVFLLDRAAAHVGGVVKLVGQFFGHALFGAAAGIGDDPAHGERNAPVLRYFDGHLIVGAAHAPRLDFEQRLGILHRLLESLERIVASAFA